MLNILYSLSLILYKTLTYCSMCYMCQRGFLRNQGNKSVAELLAFFLLLREAGSGLNTPVFGLVIHSIRPGRMGFIPGVWSPQFLEPGRWVYWIPALECGIPVESLTICISANINLADFISIEWFITISYYAIWYL